MVRVEERDGQQVIVVRRGHVEDVYPLPPDEGMANEVLANIVRMERDRLLAESDYVMMSDYPIDEGERASWRLYRQALRDLPGQEGFPRDVIYPAAPGEGEADAD